MSKEAAAQQPTSTWKKYTQIWNIKSSSLTGCQ